MSSYLSVTATFKRDSTQDRLTRKRTFHLFLLASGIAALLGPITASAAPAPKLTVLDPIYKFGTVREGTVVESLFRLRNDGDAPLEIKRIQPACGCTGAFVDSNSILPGQQSTLKVQFDTTGFIGPKVKTVRFFTNEIPNSSSVVTLSGVVQPEVEVDPIRVSFGTVQRGKVPTRIFRVFSDASTGVTVKEITPRSDLLRLDIQDLNERGKIGKLVTVSLSDRAPLGNLRERILVRTTSKRVPIINVNVFANVTGDIDFAPDEVSFGLIDGPIVEARTKTVQVRSLSGAPISIRSVQSDNRNVRAELREIEATQQYELSVTLVEGASGVIRSRVSMTAAGSDGESRTLIVPVYAIISAKGN